MLRPTKQKLLAGLAAALMCTTACLGGAQPEPPTNNWDSDAGVAPEADMGTAGYDAGFVDASASLDAGDADDAAVVPPGDYATNVTDSDGQSLGTDPRSTGALGVLNTYPGVVIPGPIPDAGVIDLGSSDDGSTAP